MSEDLDKIEKIARRCLGFSGVPRWAEADYSGADLTALELVEALAQEVEYVRHERSQAKVTP